MTAERSPDPAVPGPVAGRPSRQPGKLTGAVLSGTVLVIVNLAASFFTAVSWLLMVPEGPGDSNHIEGAWFTAVTGTILALLGALLVIVPVRARWLGKRWFIVPAVLFAVATARWVYIDTVYPEPPDRYRYGSAVLDGPADQPATGCGAMGCPPPAVR